MSEFESVLSAASRLPVTERLRLIDELAASVPDDQPPMLPKSWREEIDRRSAEIDSATVETVPWSEVRDQLFRKHGVNGAD